MRPHLRLVAPTPEQQRVNERLARPLPRLWDGRAVVWTDWGSAWSSLPLHVPLAETACTDCGSLYRMSTCTGVIDLSRDDDVIVLPPWARVKRLIAERCRECGHDRVIELAAGLGEVENVWDLNDADYGDGGSWIDGQGELF